MSEETVKRYDPVLEHGIYMSMQESSGGSFVLSEDYDNMLQKFIDLEKKLQRIEIKLADIYHSI